MTCLCVAEREELTETGLGSTARCRGRRRHRQANSVRVCSPTSRRVASLRPRSAGRTALTPAPPPLVQTGSCRRCSLIHPLHVVVDVPSRMTLFRATADSLCNRMVRRRRRGRWDPLHSARQEPGVPTTGAELLQYMRQQRRSQVQGMRRDRRGPLARPEALLPAPAGALPPIIADPRKMAVTAR